MGKDSLYHWNEVLNCYFLGLIQGLFFLSCPDTRKKQRKVKALDFFGIVGELSAGEADESDMTLLLTGEVISQIYT
jgi:hypothetical protein